MKRILATLTVGAAVVVSGYAQGTVNLNTLNGSVAESRLIRTSTGEPIAGDAYWVQLFYANGEGASEASLVAAGSPVHPRSGAGAGLLSNLEVRLDQITPPGGPATLQIRAWSATLGATHADALAAWSSQGPDNSRLYAGVGTRSSATFNFDTANPLAVPPELPGRIATAIPDVVLVPVPEPSAIALAALGGFAALVLFRRRK